VRGIRSGLNRGPALQQLQDQTSSLSSARLRVLVFSAKLTFAPAVKPKSPGVVVEFPNRMLQCRSHCQAEPRECALATALWCEVRLCTFTTALGLQRFPKHVEGSEALTRSAGWDECMQALSTGFLLHAHHALPALHVCGTELHGAFKQRQEGWKQGLPCEQMSSC